MSYEDLVSLAVQCGAHFDDGYFVCMTPVCLGDIAIELIAKERMACIKLCEAEIDVAVACTELASDAGDVNAALVQNGIGHGAVRCALAINRRFFDESEND